MQYEATGANRRASSTSAGTGAGEGDGGGDVPPRGKRGRRRRARRSTSALTTPASDTSTASQPVPTRDLVLAIGDVSSLCGPQAFHCCDMAHLLAFMEQVDASAIATDSGATDIETATANIFVIPPPNELDALDGETLKATVDIARVLRDEHKCRVLLVTDGLSNHVQQQWASLLDASAVCSRQQVESLLDAKLLVSHEGDAIWGGCLRIGGNNSMDIPGFNILSRWSTEHDSITAIETLRKQTDDHMQLLAVAPTALAVGALLHSRYELELRISDDCNAITGTLCKAWFHSGTALVLRIGDLRMLARCRSERPWIADVAPIHALTDSMLRALDMATFRKRVLGVVGRGDVYQPPECAALLPVLRITPQGEFERDPEAAEKWIDSDSFSAAMARFNLRERPRNNSDRGLHVPPHHSQVAALERSAIKRRDAARKRPRSVPTGAGGAATSTTSSIGLTTPGAQSVFGTGTGICAAATPASATTRSAATSGSMAQQAHAMQSRSQSEAALRLDRRARLQRQLAARAATAAKNPRPTVQSRHRASLEAERSAVAATAAARAARRAPEPVFGRAIDHSERFLDCADAAAKHVDQLMQLALPEPNSQGCIPAHGVEFASDKNDRRDEALHRYEKEVGRTELEHASAWDKAKRPGALESICDALCGVPQSNQGSASAFNWRAIGTNVDTTKTKRSEKQSSVDSASAVQKPNRRSRKARLPAYMRAAQNTEPSRTQ